MTVVSASIKKVTVDRLRPGMFIHDLNCAWIDHPFGISRFRIKDNAQLSKIRALGIPEVYIDTRRGLDVLGAPRQVETQRQVARDMEAIARTPKQLLQPVPLAEELASARKLHAEANQVVKGILEDVRLGR